MLDGIEKSLPEGMVLNRDVFRQAEFIERSLDNVLEVLRDATIIVTVITSVVRMPISFIVGLAGPLRGDPTAPESMLATMGPLTLVSMRNNVLPAVTYSVFMSGPAKARFVITSSEIGMRPSSLPAGEMT